MYVEQVVKGFADCESEGKEDVPWVESCLWVVMNCQ